MPSEKFREVFLAHAPPGPWPCGVCGVLIGPEELHQGRGKSPAIHHLDGDHENDAPENLQMTHFSCHRRLHTLGIKNPDHSAKIKQAWREGRYAGIDWPLKNRRWTHTKDGRTRSQVVREAYALRAAKAKEEK